MRAGAAVDARVFIDTNLLVYSLHAGDAPDKSARAIEMLTVLRELQVGSLSAQVIAEFVSVARRKLGDTLARETALRAARLFTEQFTMVPLDEIVVREALAPASATGSTTSTPRCGRLPR